MFEVGDRVVCLENYDNAPIVGREATIVHMYGRDHLCLEFDEVVGPTCGHSCDGYAKKRHGWNVPRNKVRLITKDNRSLVERKCRKLWNKSKWVKAHPEFAY